MIVALPFVLVVCESLIVSRAPDTVFVIAVLIVIALDRSSTLPLCVREFVVYVLEYAILAISPVNAADVPPVLLSVKRVPEVRPAADVEDTLRAVPVVNELAAIDIALPVVPALIT